jgi:prephenate dehydrogenase
MNNKITIIGLGLVGNSIGMGLKKFYAGGGAQGARLVGFDPDRTREEYALRKHFSVDEIAPDLETAVRGASMVIIATPAEAMREVLEAIDPFLEPGTTVTDTLSTKEQVMAWAGEVLSEHSNFIGGHPVPRLVDTELPGEGAEAMPRADLFVKSPYCIMPLPSSSSEALNAVIYLAEALGAKPLFIDPREHDSFLAAVSNLPVLASAAFLDVTSGSPSWGDMSVFAREQFKQVAAPLSGDAEGLHAGLMNNRQAVLYWLDNYLLALQDLGDLLAKGDSEGLLALIKEAHNAHEGWVRMEREAADSDDPMAARRVSIDEETREQLSQAIEDSKPGRRLLGRYIGDRVFGKRDG